jgi:hypothetical protein
VAPFCAWETHLFIKRHVKMKKCRKNVVSRAQRKVIAAAAFASLAQATAVAQGTPDGKAGITQATTMVSSYFDVGATLMYAVGGILGLIGAVKVYSKWSHGDPDTGKVAAAWFGACVFLVVVATVIKSFFGITTA